MGNGSVFGLSGTVGNNRLVFILSGNIHRFQSFTKRADLVYLNQYGIAYLSAIPFLNILGLVTKISSPTNCVLEPRRTVSSFQPAQSFSDRPSSMEKNWIFGKPILINGNHLLRILLGIFKFITAILTERTGGAV